MQSVTTVCYHYKEASLWPVEQRTTGSNWKKCSAVCIFWYTGQMMWIFSVWTSCSLLYWSRIGFWEGSFVMVTKGCAGWLITDCLISLMLLLPCNIWTSEVREWCYCHFKMRRKNSRSTHKWRKTKVICGKSSNVIKHNTSRRDYSGNSAAKNKVTSRVT